MECPSCSFAELIWWWVNSYTDEKIHL